MSEATTSGSLTPSQCVARAMAQLNAEDDLSPQTLARLEVLMSQFARFAERAFGVTALDGVRPAMVVDYLTAATTAGEQPGVSLQHFRRLAVRVLFRTCRSLGVVAGDPSLDAELPVRARATFRPLEDDEVSACRAAVTRSRIARSAAAWALCEATARTGELPKVTRGDVDSGSGRIWIAGTPRTLPRWGELTEWGSGQIARHLTQINADPATPLICGSPDAALAQSSAVGIISRTLRYAGLGEAPGVRPSSVAAWAGRAIFDETGRIDLAAQRLGMRSLDRTAVFIGWDWASADG